jgi:isocitrate/isopropylmalate dehydrogenase
MLYDWSRADQDDAAGAGAPAGTFFDETGTGAANPYAAMASSAMLLDCLGYAEAATCLRDCLRVAARGRTATRDLGGTATTDDFTATVLDLVERRLRGHG